jgi:hypothetical protein
VLSGGAALAGFHLKHRTTRDLDLFWHGREGIALEAAEVRRRLEKEGVQIDTIQSSPAFWRFRVTDRAETVIVDLVADQAPVILPPVGVTLIDTVIWVDAPHEILVNTLCALLGRMELRDLIDLQALLDAGEDLAAGLRDAPRKDAGFSPVTLAWVLRDLPLAELADRLGHDGQSARRLIEARDGLVARLLELAKPD